MRKQKEKMNKGFSLVELMVVIAIIGILTSVVTVSMTGSIQRSKKASALTTASSVLPELVTCIDDGGNVAAPGSATAGGNQICSAAGHTALWPSLGNTGWSYNAAAQTPILSTYTFRVQNAGDPTSPINCSVAANGCN